ncbi:peptide-N(4)-(N-acetyl-beta-glucosaminyl)asparagine amidase [Thecamonas trahens ATCC 50062]|uniref:Peptide-N(4)-(N-acetyl-beta-glucosaminyl)asparagine amidase n=1 Tax=Thecamonas trahens ATCC 50062 TaxID=461836 RepID=A0A0L0D8M7_THETB|nr:peptide-N(4)-(N-acetyl-beta-glucosaminyl)asparagine amidase [Thecamonas trahens ATCC 50062]KNC47643.1 peptide-N(4)-(N-acetyl-beta-glucosaminyl)asparagine amidase [Thecamonas trahens ATCC 50062]|eukprot:XP_013759127.1 peptide-N(4)-(N-acetyl-beta-glucosaminyl)asparagine amidase [Thecamonas trahens ATCC 50062]
MAGAPAADGIRVQLMTAAEGAAKAAAERGQRAFANSIVGSLVKVRKYEDNELRARALSVIPSDKLEAAAAAAVAQSGRAIADELLRQLLTWFKEEFFAWCQAPVCRACGGGTQGAGAVAPAAEEAAFGAAVTEIYRCPAAGCGAETRFPRYNDPGKLLETRMGKCGEFANAFTLCCVAMGYEARHVHDHTDHVWTEVWSAAQHRWIHCDPCESQMDNPLLYEAGWGKQLNYIIAVSVTGVADVTRRYTRQWDAVAARRTKVSEAWLANHIAELNAGIQAALPPKRARDVAARLAAEQVELAVAILTPLQAAERARLRGRMTGSVEWRAARAELGLGDGETRIEVVEPIDPAAPTRIRWWAPARAEFEASYLDAIAVRRVDGTTVDTQRVFAHGEDHGEVVFPPGVVAPGHVVVYLLCGDVESVAASVEVVAGRERECERQHEREHEREHERQHEREHERQHERKRERICPS